MPRRLRPTAEIHADAILVGDPGRAMALAQALTEGAKMANHARGLWGYSGRRPDGRGLTVASTGMGGPSAALVLADLAELGVERAVRVGTCAAIDPGRRPGDLIWVREARPWTVDQRGAGPVAHPDEALAGRLLAELGDAARPGSVASLDALHPSPGRLTPQADAADMQTAALFAAGAQLGVAVAAVLIVTDAEGFDPLGDEKREDLAKLAAEAGSRSLP